MAGEFGGPLGGANPQDLAGSVQASEGNWGGVLLHGIEVRLPRFGVPFAKGWIQKLQSKVNSLFCGLFGLSDRTRQLWLYLQVQYGGLGCHGLRSERIFVTYIKQCN